MNAARAFATVAGSMVLLTGLAADPERYVQIGDIPAACPITIKRSAAQLPSSFRVTPEEAVTRASVETNVKCNSIFEQVVYADRENYYIIKSIHGPMSEKVEAVVINGTTGKVSARK